MNVSIISDFKKSISDCRKTLRVIKKHNINLTRHSFYSEKMPSKLAVLRKEFLKLQRNFSAERHPSIAFKLVVIEPLINKLIEIYPIAPPTEMLELLKEISFKVDSELIAEIEIMEANKRVVNTSLFLPEDIIENRHYILKKVLWEVNQTYEVGCYNSCASMIRRMIETLIIDAYEHQGLGAIIKDDNNDYFTLKKLIGKASNQREFRLTQGTKRALPDLKFFGDLGSHNRMAIVRKHDLDRLHNSIRISIEELTRNIE